MVQISDWVQLIQVFVTLGLVYYAYVTINEAKKNRRKDTIERMLENIYSPMREILTRARREDTSLRASIRKEPAKNGIRDYVLSPQEYDQIQRMIDQFGYYLGSVELGRLRMDFEKYEVDIPPYKPEEGPISWFRYNTDVFDNHWRFFQSKCDELTAELDALVGLSKSITLR